MFISHTIGDEQLDFDAKNFIDISIPILEENSTNAFHLPEPHFAPFAAGNFIGSIEQGGPVRCEVLTIAPHGNGTHTECIGHILGRGYSVLECLQEVICTAQVVTVPLQDEDDICMCVTAEALQWAWTKKSADALIVRTTPNSVDKKTRKWSGNTPPYITPEAMQIIANRKVKHLLVDFPSVDPEVDGGAMASHKIFWNVPNAPRINNTITELIYVPDSSPDGIYLLAFNVGGIHADAVPSRPVLFPRIKKN